MRTLIFQQRGARLRPSTAFHSVSRKPSQGKLDADFTGTHRLMLIFLSVEIQLTTGNSLNSDVKAQNTLNLLFNENHKSNLHMKFWVACECLHFLYPGSSSPCMRPSARPSCWRWSGGLAASLPAPTGSAGNTNMM